MESEQPTAVKASAPIEEPQSTETAVELGKHSTLEADLSTDKLQTATTGKLISFLCYKFNNKFGISMQKLRMP